MTGTSTPAADSGAEPGAGPGVHRGREGATPGTGTGTGTGKQERGPWYRRRGVVLGACVAVVLVITVITDLPSHASRATNIASSNAVVKEVNTDISPCVFAANEAFTIYGYQVHKSLTASDRANVPALLNDDQTACSFTNDSIFSLSDIEVPGSSAGKQLGNIVSSVTLWTTSDALGRGRRHTDPHAASDQRRCAGHLVQRPPPTGLRPICSRRLPAGHRHLAQHQAGPPRPASATGAVDTLTEPVRREAHLRSPRPL